MRLAAIGLLSALSMPALGQTCEPVDADDFGACDFVLGWAWTGAMCEEVSGCSTIDGSGRDRADAFYGTRDRCYVGCGTCPVLDPNAFGDCDMALGWGPTRAGCESISGCSTTDLRGNDWSAWFFRSELACLDTCPAGLVLSPPDPGAAGVINTATVTGATADGQVGFAVGTTPGATEVPGCPGVRVPIVAEAGKVVTAGRDGTATVSGMVPANRSGDVVSMVAVDLSTCTASNVTTTRLR